MIHKSMQAIPLIISALFAAESATAFSSGDPCVSPYVIADGDVNGLRAAMLCANTDGTDSVVELANDGLYVFTDADPGDASRAVRAIGTNGLFTLLGIGATLQRDPAAVATFGILDASIGSNVELQDLTLAGGSVDGGSPGAGLRVRGTVRASSIRVVDNLSLGRGGGIVVSNNGTLVLTDSTVAGNSAGGDGGGVRVDGGSALWLVRSTVQGNSVTGTGHGGGIQTSGLTRVLNSTILENVVLQANGRGGGMDVDSGGDATIVNATLMDNESPADGEQLRRRGSGQVAVYNSILGESVADGIEDCSLPNPPSDTLVFDGSCDATLSGAVPFLAPGVGANGTRFLPVDSGAASVIDAANPDWLREVELGLDLNGDGDSDDDFISGIDQSGKPRAVFLGIELGAVEWACGFGGRHFAASAGELIEAIGCANSDATDSTLELVSQQYLLSSIDNNDAGLGGNGLPRIIDDGDLTILGHQASIGRDPTAGDDFRILFVDTDLNTVALHDLVIEGGRQIGSSERGGGIYNRGNLQLHRSVVRNNSTNGITARGGGIHNLGNLLLSGSLIDGNTTFDDASAGGGLNNEGSGAAILVNSTVTRNSANGPAGGIRSDGDNTLLLLVNSTISYNASETTANEISVFDGTVLSYNSLVVTAAGAACEGGGSLAFLVENGMASDPNCGATLTADPLLAGLDESGFVAYYPLSGGNVDTVNSGSSDWLDEALVGFDLNGDGDTLDDLSGASDQSGAQRLRCAEVDLGAVEYVECDATYTIGGTLSGLADGNVVNLTLNGDVSVDFGANGVFSFPGSVGYGGNYVVTITAQPTDPDQTCTLSNDSGRVAAANVTDVLVSCINDEVIVSPASGPGGSITPDTPLSVPFQSMVAFTLAPDPNHQLFAVTGSCGGTLDGLVYTTEPVLADCSVQASFRPLSSTALVAPTSPLRLGQSALLTVDVTGLAGGPPQGGSMQISLSSGESCTDSGPPSIVGDTARYSCALTPSQLGDQQAQASYSGSTSHFESDSSSVPVAVRRFADLSAVLDDGQSAAVPGASVQYLLLIRNNGPDPAPASAVLLAAAPALIDAQWSCSASGGASCPAASGSGELSLMVDLPVGGGLDLLQSGQWPAQLPPSVVVQAQVSAAAANPNWVFDPQPADNESTDLNSVEGIFADGFE